MSAAKAARAGGRRLLRGLALAALCLLLAWLAAFAAFLRALPRAAEAPHAVTDAIVVLTGGSGRLAAGIDLLARDKAGKLFISGVHQGVGTAELLRPFGRPELACCIALGYTAADTRGNARETAAWARAAGVRSLRLVTAGYHMPRALVEFRRAMPETLILAHPVFPPHVAVADWWLRPGTAWLLAGEHVKYLASRLQAALPPFDREIRP